MNHHAHGIIDPNRFQRFLPDLAIAIDDVAGFGRAPIGQKANCWTLDAIEGRSDL
jgi:hypothetical protein